MSTPEKKRTPAQKKLAKGLEDVAARSPGKKSPRPSRPTPADHARRERLKREIYEIERTLPRPPAHAMALVDQKSKATDTFVLRRGDYKNRGPKVAPRPPGVILASQPAGAFTQPSIDAKRRQDRPPGGAGAMAGQPGQSLDGRVIVNRLWQHHFGRGIVATPSDFGVRGEPPSHPELLDWLASELVAARLAAQAAPSSDGDLGDLSPVEPAEPEAGGRRSREHAVRPDEPPPARRRRQFATPCWPSRASSIPRWAGRACSRRSRRKSRT